MPKFTVVIRAESTSKEALTNDVHRSFLLWDDSEPDEVVIHARKTIERELLEEGLYPHVESLLGYLEEDKNNE